MQNDSIDNLRLDLNRERVRGVIYVRAGDTRARTIHITLVNNGTVVDLSEAVFCELLIKKPDLNENDQTMVRYGNELQYTFRTQDINVPGECRCQVMVTFSDGTIVTSPEFAVMVFAKTIDPSFETSTNEYTAIQQVLVDVTGLKNDCITEADRAESEADRAKDEADRAEDAEEITDGLKDDCTALRDECIEIAEGLEGVMMPQGTITFADLADVTMMPGFMWEISDSFTTDSRFAEGASHVMAAGTNVYVTIHEKFACISATEPNELIPTFTEAETRANIASGEKLPILLGKIKKYFTDLKAVAFSNSYNDLDNKPTIPAAQVQSDWNEADNTKVDFIKNKPDITALTNRVSDLETTVGNILDVLGYPYNPS